MTIADRLRAVRRRSREDLPDLLDELRETYTAFSEASDVVDSIDELKVGPDDLFELLRRLGRNEEANDAEDLAASWNCWIESVELPDLSSFVETFDELESAIESFESLMEQDNYPGIGDERAEAWAEVEANAEMLADAVDSLGIEDVDETGEEAGVALLNDRFSPDGVDISVPEAKWTDGQRRVVAYARVIGLELLGYTPSVGIVSDITLNAAAYFGGSTLKLNVGRLGHAWFNNADPVKVDALLIHEFAHDRVSNHLSEDFHEECCRLGARLRDVTVRLHDIALAVK